MIIFFDNDGRVITTTNATVYQGDSAMGRIVIVSPFPNNTGFTVSLTLPDGTKTQEYACSLDISETGFDFGGVRPVIHKLATPATVFSLVSGRVRVQCYAYTPIGGRFLNTSDPTTWSERKALDPTEITVIQGNYVLPSNASEIDQWQSIILALGNVSGQINKIAGNYGLSIFYYDGVLAYNPIYRQLYPYNNTLVSYIDVGRLYQRGQMVIDRLANLYVCEATKEAVDAAGSAAVANGARFLLGLKGTQQRVTFAFYPGTEGNPTDSNYWWKSLDDSEPYKYYSKFVLPIGVDSNSYVELINDNPVLFAKYGFAIGEITGLAGGKQYITFWAIRKPEVEHTLTIGIGGIKNE